MSDKVEIDELGVLEAIPSVSRRKPMSKECLYFDADGQRKQAKARRQKVDYFTGDDDKIAMVGAIQNRNNTATIEVQSVDELKGIIDAYWEYIMQSYKDGHDIDPDWEGFCSYFGESRETLENWIRTNHKEFGHTLSVLKNDIASFKKYSALHGKIPPMSFAIDMNNNHGYVQNKNTVEINVTTPTLPDKNALLMEAQLLLENKT